MQLITDHKKKKIDLIAQIQAEFKFLMASDKDAQKTPIYKVLADKHGLSERTILSYCK